MDSDPAMEFSSAEVCRFQCEMHVYEHGNKCGDKAERGMCATDDMTNCRWSWPEGDAKKSMSPDAACRTLPSSEPTPTEDLVWSSHKFADAGVDGCPASCETDCHMAWPANDPAIDKSDNAMLMCIPSSGTFTFMHV